MRLSFLASLFCVVVVAHSCGNANDERNNTAQTAEASKPLLSNPAKPADATFQRQYIADASFELPTGTGWSQEDEATFHHRDWDMTIVVQSEPQDMRSAKKDYLNSYNEANERDAPGWKRGPEQIGTVAGKDAARTGGSFNNGTAYTTRDYIFFDKNKTVILQSRVAEANAVKLAPVVDYIASTYQ